MPAVTIRTNLANVPENFICETSELVADLLGKPVAKVMCMCLTSVPMKSACTDDDCVFMSVQSIGMIGPEQNAVYATAITKHMVEKLGVKPERVFLLFEDLNAFNVATAGELVANKKKS